MRRFKGDTISRVEARFKYQKLFINSQEAVLVDHIRKLSDRKFHLTPQILENLVIEIVRCSIGSRWIERFQKRYENELISVYLCNIDQSRYIADNFKHFEHYYTIMSRSSRTPLLPSYTHLIN